MHLIPLRIFGIALAKVMFCSMSSSQLLPPNDSLVSHSLFESFYPLFPASPVHHLSLVFFFPYYFFWLSEVFGLRISRILDLSDG